MHIVVAKELQYIAIPCLSLLFYNLIILVNIHSIESHTNFVVFFAKIIHILLNVLV